MIRVGRFGFNNALIMTIEKDNNILHYPKIDKVVTSVRVHSLPLIAEILEKSPEHLFGGAKAAHMERLLGQVSDFAVELGLDPHETGLLAIILRSHDIGRHIEVINNLHTLRPGVRHGILSANFLNEKNILEDFSPNDQYVITKAVEWHSELKVPEKDENVKQATFDRARKLCYFLRDMDKEDILAEERFMNPLGILEQIDLHYLTEDERSLLSNDELKDVLLVSILNSLSERRPTKKTGSDFSEGQPLDIRDKVTAIMNNELTSDAIDMFVDKETIPIANIVHSYANYMLTQVAMIFDLELPSSVKKLYDQAEYYLGPRLRFIQMRTTPEEFSQIISTLVGFFGERLPKKTIRKEFL